MTNRMTIKQRCDYLTSERLKRKISNIQLKINSLEKIKENYYKVIEKLEYENGR